ncbi:MAG: adenosylcobinamide-GDP ribazoletransferase [Alphaproteobacteria bacterium]
MQGPHPHDRIEEWREDLTVAFGFLTRLPVRSPQLLEPGRLTHALRLSPAVGAFVGAFGGSFYWLALSFGFSGLIAAVIGIAAAAILTGGLHEDALSDMTDGFSGGWTIERKLEIMSDGRIGAHGSLALMLALLLRVGAVAQLGSADRVMAALIAAGALSRAIMYAAMAVLPHARQTGLGHSAGMPTGRQAMISLALGFGIAWLALPFGTALSASIWACAGGLLVAWLAKRQIGGQTGDILGSVQQISELFALLLLTAMLTN